MKLKVQLLKKLILPLLAKNPLSFIHELAINGLKNIGHHGEMVLWGTIKDLPKWSDIQILTAQMAKKPLNEGTPVKTSIIIGPNLKSPRARYTALVSI